MPERLPEGVLLARACTASSSKLFSMRFRNGIAIICFSITCGIATGQTKLSLQEALAKAEHQNLDLAAARERRAFALAGIQIAKQRPNPTLGFSASRDAPHEGATLDQPFELGPKRGRRIEVAKGESVLTDLEIAALARQVRHSVRDAYHQAEFTRAVSAQKSELLALARRLHEIAGARFNAGDVPQLEVVQSDLEVARADAELQLAHQEEQVAASRLNALLNEPRDSSWELADTLETLPAAPPLDDLNARAAQSNPDLQHARQEAAIEVARANLLRAERIPDFTAGIGADFNNPGSYTAGLRGQFSVALPIFSRNQGEIAQSLSTQRQLSLQLLAQQRTIQSEVQAAALEFVARASQVKIFHDSLSPAAKRLTGMAEDSYKAGQSSILTVIDAQRNASQVQAEFLDSLLAAHASFATLEETVGAPLD
jgi:outer membrane protein, heavy metal efflux system